MSYKRVAEGDLIRRPGASDHLVHTTLTQVKKVMEVTPIQYQAKPNPTTLIILINLDDVDHILFYYKFFIFI